MRISLDAGGLCVPSQKRFGTYTFTRNIIEAFAMYDPPNEYTAYSFCKRPAGLVDFKNVQFRRLLPKTAWMAVRVSMEEILRRNDIFFGLSQAIPWMTPARVFAFIHGLSFFYYQDLYRDSYDTLKHQLMYAVTRAETIFVSSSKVKREIEDVFKHGNIIVIPMGIPFDMRTKSKEKKVNSKKPYFMFVGMNRPIKQVDFLVNAFRIFKESKAYADFELILVGDFKEFENRSIKIRSIEIRNREELRQLYSASSGYLTCSSYESFNFPVLEALSQGTSVVAKKTAVIPEMRPYVYEAEHAEAFVEHMKILAQENGKKVPVEEIESKFDWKKTVEIITKQYRS